MPLSTQITSHSLQCSSLYTTLNPYFSIATLAISLYYVPETLTVIGVRAESIAPETLTVIGVRAESILLY